MEMKKYPTLGCCGLDCGLCPRFYTEGSSRCPGCAGPDFFSKHPSCSFITCCVREKKLEVCGQCKEFPCAKFSREGKADSFVTHRKVMANQELIKKEGVEKFITLQKKRIALLKEMFKDFDDGRSKSYFCLAAAIMEIGELEKALAGAKKRSKGLGIKEKSGILHSILDDIAKNRKYFLKLVK
jgi:hypothetical protein